MSKPEVFSFDEPTATARAEQVAVITRKAIEAGRSYRIETRRIGDWYGATVTVYPAGASEAA